MKACTLMLCCLIVLTSLAACQAADLPLTRVALFTSGVGYFEREGMVQGNATVELSFRTEQINDILKSLVLQDLSGGAIAPVTYASQEPLARTLSSFEVNIADNPSLRQLWDRLRGSAVRIVTDAATVEGTAFGSEEHQEFDARNVLTVVEVLNLMTHKGLMQFPTHKIRSAMVLDAKVDADLRKALTAIDRARDTDRKSVVLSFKGQGERKVRVGYLLETPLWKTTYRLVADKDGLFLQGWALVENTTDDDWTNVRLSLISGRPVSFTQDLYQPLYLPRVQVPVAVAAAARPRLYEGAMERRQEEQAGGGFGGGGGMGGRAGDADRFRAEKAPGAPAVVMRPTAAPAPPPAESLARGRAAAMAEGGQVGTLFQYAISQPVTIPRQRSAMIPIISQKVEGEKVSVYNQYADARHPMNGIRLKNSSTLHLMGGAITVFDGGAYGGDALIEDIPPGDERLLTYAMDLAVEVEPQAKSQPDQLLTAKVVNGVMSLTYKSRMETTYNVKNVAAEKRTVLIEHPLRPDWKLIEPKEASERTRSVYRFRVPVEPKQTAKLTVIEEMPRLEVVKLSSEDMSAYRLLVTRAEITGAVRTALMKLVEMQTQLADLSRQRTEKETRLKEIEQEQERIRNNMKELDRASELYKQYVEKLTRQETEFEALRQEIADLRVKEAAKRQEIAAYISSLSLD